MLTMARLLRHRQTKGAVTDRLGLRNTKACSLLYPVVFNGFFGMPIPFEVRIDHSAIISDNTLQCDRLPRDNLSHFIFYRFILYCIEAMNSQTKGTDHIWSPADVHQKYEKRKNRTMKLGRPREYDIEEALDIAMHLFWRKGYDDTSLNDLLDAMRISRSIFYYTFGSKYQLFELCIYRLRDQQIAKTRQRLICNKQPMAEVSLRNFYMISYSCRIPETKNYHKMNS